MIQEFVKDWLANADAARSKFREKRPRDYKDVVRIVVETLADASDEYDKPDPERIHEINDGDYQGTLVYVIGASGYQPSKYWWAKVSYGSCSGCDTLEAIRDDYPDAETPNEEQVKDYMTLALHIIEGLHEMDEAK